MSSHPPNTTLSSVHYQNISTSLILPYLNLVVASLFIAASPFVAASSFASALPLGLCLTVEMQYHLRSLA